MATNAQFPPNTRAKNVSPQKKSGCFPQPDFLFFPEISGNISCLPQLHPRAIRQIHFLTGLHVKRVVEFRNVGQRTVHAPLRRAVYVGNEAVGQLCVADLIQPAQRITEEKALHRHQAVNGLVGLVSFGGFKRIGAWASPTKPNWPTIR